MNRERSLIGGAVIAMVLAVSAIAADKGPVGSTAWRPPVPLDSEAMNTMLRADRDKDGMLSREELEQYDLGLARRFNEADADRDGKLTLYEFDSLLPPAENSARR